MDADVIVVGAGPTGLLVAGELAEAGARVVVLERRAEESNLTPGVRGARPHHGAAAHPRHDRELAACSGVRVDRLTLILLVLVAIAVAAGIRLTGALLVDALTLLPALAARRLANSLTTMAITAVAVGVVVNIAGFTLAVALDLPPGPVLVLLAGAVALVVRVIPDWRRRGWPSSDETGSRASRSVPLH